MPSPTMESYLGESRLVAYKHYVPLEKPDHIEKTLDWMRANDKKCQTIVKEANKFINEHAPRSVGDGAHVAKAAAAWWAEAQEDLRAARPSVM